MGGPHGRKSCLRHRHVGRRLYRSPASDSGSALNQARAAANGREVAIAGGAATVNQYLAAGAIDELRTHVTPVVVGAGERLFEGVGPRRYALASARPASLVTHITYLLTN